MIKSRNPFGIRPLAVSVLVVCVVLSLFSNGGLLPVYAAGTITGTVFQDFNGNGTFDTSGAAPNLAVDTGVAGVTVTAYESTGAVAGSATTVANGTYTLNAIGTGPYRIEFTTIPAGFQPSAHSTAAGSNGTTVQFVPDGNTANVNLGLLKPGTYCQNNPNLITNCYAEGNQQTGAFNGDPVLVSFQYGATGTVGHTTLAIANQIGSTWGLAWRRSSRTVFSAAFVKRFAGLGLGVGGNPANAPGTIYRTNLAGVSTAFAVVPNAGTDSHPTSDVNCTPVSGAPVTGAPPSGLTCWQHDQFTWNPVGKTGLGDLEIVEDVNNAANDALFVVNLNDRHLYKVTTLGNPAGTVTDAGAIPLATGAAVGCPAGDVRPFALADNPNDGLLYVGEVCSAESSGNRNNLRAYVYSFNPTSSTFSGAPIFEAALDYGRGFTDDPLVAPWQPWVPTFATPPIQCSGCGGGGGTPEVSYPQPMLTDITFDMNGGMTLGIRDRFSDQGARSGASTDTTDTTLYKYISAGDTLRACLVGAAWTLENNGLCNGVGPGAVAGDTQSQPQGPGGHEFYYNDALLDAGGNVLFHEELSLGGLVQVPGYREVVSTVFDPLVDNPAFDTGGVRHWNSNTGALTGAYQIYDNVAGTFAKAGGLGDLEALCDAAPIEIGNRVWVDTNGNGIQDADELPRPGVVINLYDSTGTIVGTTTTDTNGEYYFTNLSQNTQYFVVVAPSNFTGAGALVGFTPTLLNAGPVQRDSNGTAITVPGLGSVTGTSITTGGAGSNDHTIDFGFNNSAVYSLGNRVWLDSDNSGTINAADGANPGIANVTVNLLNNALTVIATTTTDANGYYRFDNLAAGDYTVEVAATNFAGAGVLVNRNSSTPDEVNPNADVDSNDNGIGTTPGVNGIRSGVVTLGPGASEPTGETDLAPSGQGAADDHANMTVDFGFVPLYSLGNRVWLDADNSGTINVADGANPGIAGVTVNLLDNTLAVIATTTTDANGYYRFDNLAAGTYTVQIAATNFAGAGVLVGRNSSTPDEVNPNLDVDSNDNGIGTTPGVNGIRSGPVTLGPGGSEPINEADLGPGGQGPNPDNQSNMTVDFGFVPIYSLGNRVWTDVDNSGTINPADGANPGIAGVTVNLLDNTLAVIATTTTDANGYYRFDNLVAGNYTVEIAATNFAGAGVLVGRNSSTPDEVNPNLDVDSNDNGIGTTPGVNGIRSGVVTLGPGATEPTGETDLAASGQGAPDDHANMTVDFGFPPPPLVYSLGNRVWLDADNSGTINAADGANPGIAGVTVNLLDNTLTVIATTTTDANGYYRFDNLVAGNYTVEIAATNFAGAGVLVGRPSSTPDEVNPNSDVDSNDNGIGTTPGVNGIRSGVVTLGPGTTEPTGETDLGPGGQGPSPDNQANMTVDFGFVPVYSLGNRVWLDADNSGTINPADGANPGIAGVTVNLLDNTLAVIATTTTDANGYYRFDNLIAGNYTVEIAATNFTGAGVLVGRPSSTPDEVNPNSDVDNNDNGIGTTPGVNGIRSGVVTLGPGGSEPTGETDLAASGQGAPDNHANMTVDFGFVPTYSLGNRVWTDVDNSGTINPADGANPGIGGVTVQLLDSTGTTILATTTTDANGYYRFDNLAAGDYLVQVAPANFAGAGVLVGRNSSTPDEVNPNLDVDSNDNGIGTTPGVNGIRSGIVTLGPGGSEPTGETDLAASGQGGPDDHANMTVDFGFPPVAVTYSLGNRVWLDADNSGTINPADGANPGIAGVTVNLLNNAGTVIATTTTDANGYYRFDNLAAGNYTVEIAATNFAGPGVLVGRNSSTPDEVNPNSDVDSNDNGIGTTPGVNGIRSGVVTLGPGGSEPTGETDLGPGGQGPSPDNQANMTVDFGFVQLYSLGNRVWTDVDDSGTINPADGANPGIAGVTVNLLNSAGTTVLGTTTTDANGYYRFDNLLPGDYLVQVAASNFAGAGVLVGRNSSTPDEVNPNLDVDSNDNGIGITPGVNGIRSGIVTLGPGGSEPTGETDLAASGQGAADDHANMTVDFGFPPIPTYSLGNRVWLDADNSGTINPADGANPGIGGVTVNLLNNVGTVIATTTTDANGYYRFDNLAAGDYTVEIAATNFTGAGVLVGRPSSTPDEVNPNADVDSNDNGIGTTPGVNGIRSGVVTLGPGSSEPTGETDLGPGGQGTGPDNRANMTVDFGFVQLYSLGNRVWSDVDNSGTINPADGANPGLGGVTVQLLNSTGTTVLATTTTDANGHYRFDNLLPGDYLVQVAASNFTTGNPLFGRNSSTPDEVNPNADVDSNDNGIGTTPGVNGIRSGIVTLGPGATEPTGETDLAASGQGAADDHANMTVDFGFPPPPVTAVYSLGNRVWSDVDNSGTINPADGANPGIGGVTVNLLNNVGTVIATTTTDANGYYRFDNLPAGDYTVEIAAPNFQTGGALAGRNSSTPDEVNPNADVDSNDNGIGTTPGVNGIRSGVVTLGPGGSEPTGETDLGPGGQGPSPDNQANMTVDFGFPPATTYSLGNRVWLDVDNSGTINPADGANPGIGGVTVNLLNSAGTTVLATTTTDANGYYRFDNLLAGDYLVQVAATNFAGAGVLVGRNSSTPDEANPNADVDSNDNGIGTAPGVNGIRSGVVTLGPGGSEPINEADLGPGGQGPNPDNQANMTVDFGFVPGGATYSLGNRVWSDVDNSGTINPADGANPGIAGVVVNLLNGAGTVIATATTDANGYYRFDNLVAGSYTVEIAASNFTGAGVLVGRASSTPDEVNPNSDVDSNDNGIGTTPGVNGIRSGVVILGPGGSEPTGETDLGPGGQGPSPDNQANMTVDFGFVPPVPTYSLGNRVWSDLDNSGTINPADGANPGIGGVTVQLLNSTGTTVVATTTTDANGYYRFDNLLPGDYLVQIAPTNFTGAGVLVGRASSTPDEANPNADVDSNDNGIGTTPGVNGIRSGVVTLGPGGSEPINEADLGPGGQGAADDHANMTVDFGFVPPVPTYSLGNRVWSDVDNSGTINPADGAAPGIGGVTVQLLDSTGTNILASTTTDANGYYRFDNLLPGDYLVQIPATNFAAGGALAGRASSTPDEVNPNADVDSNDNGIGTTPGVNGIRSGIVTLGPGGSEPINEADLGPGGQGPNPDTQANMTVDFGFVPGAIVPPPGPTGVPIIGVADPAVVKLADPTLALPGEIVKFTITVTNHGTAPANSVVLSDIPVPTPLIVIGVTTSQGSFTVNGNNVTVNIGVLNPGQVITIIITARVRPDIIPPLDLTNTVTLDWAGGSRRFGSATIHITRGQLPATGEIPTGAGDPANIQMGLLAAVGVLIGLVAVRRKRQQRQRSLLQSR